MALVKRKSAISPLDARSCESNRQMKYEKPHKRWRIVSPTPEQSPKTSTAAVPEVDKEPQKQVSFGSVQVRNYRRMLGENPFLEIPLGLDWEYDEDAVATIDSYDKAHQTDDYVSAHELEPLSLSQRYHRLQQAGFSSADIRLAERRRRVQIALEWAFRNNADEVCACSCPNASVFLKRYILS